MAIFVNNPFVCAKSTNFIDLPSPAPNLAGLQLIGKGIVYKAEDLEPAPCSSIWVLRLRSWEQQTASFASLSIEFWLTTCDSSRTVGIWARLAA